MKAILMKFYHFATTLVEASFPGFLSGERRLANIEESWTTRGGGQGWAGWRTDKRFTGCKTTKDSKTLKIHSHTETAGVNGRETKWRGLEKWCGLTLVHPIQDHGRGKTSYTENNRTQTLL